MNPIRICFQEVPRQSFVSRTPNLQNRGLKLPIRLPNQSTATGIPCGRKLINVLVIVQLHIIRACPCGRGGCIRTASGATAARLTGATAGAGTATGTTKAATAKAAATTAAAETTATETTAAGPAAATAAAETGTGTAVTKEQIIDDVPKSGRLICTAAAAEAIGKNRGNTRRCYCNRANN